MSKGLHYILGILTGVLLTLVFFQVRNVISRNGASTESTEKQAKLPEGVTMLDEPIPFTEAKNFEILQVVFDDAALAQLERRMQYTGSIYYDDPVVLIVADQNNIFYDDQIVKCPKDSKVMQIGTYQYKAKMGWKTVPIIHFTKQK